MVFPQHVLASVLVLAGALACGNDEVVNGFAVYGSGRLQGFVTRPDGSPVADISVFGDFGPGAFGHSVQTDSRGLYELHRDSHTSLDQPPFSEGAIPCRVTVGAGLADTLVTVRFAPTGQSPVPVTLNLVVDAP